MGVFAFGAEAQYPLLGIGNQTLGFNTSIGEVTSLPQPTPLSGYPAGYFYAGQQPLRMQHIQFNHNGELLFFIIDGNIFNHAGYLISGSFYSNIPGVWSKIGQSKDVAVTSVPGECMKFIIFFDYNSYISSESLDSNLMYVVLDLTVPSNLYPSSLGVLGKLLVNDELPAEHPNLGEANVSGITISTLAPDIPNSNEPSPDFKIEASGSTVMPGAVHYAVHELADNSKKYVFITRVNDLYVIEIDHLGLVSITSEVFYPSGTARTLPEGELAFSHHIQGGFVLAIGITKHDENNPTIPNQWINVKFVFFDNEMELQYINSINAAQEIGAQPFLFYGLEFDPTGRYLYYTTGVNPPIGFIDFNTYQHSPLPFSLDAEFITSNMELNQASSGNPGEQSLYLYGNNSVLEIKNPSVPSLLEQEVLLVSDPISQIPTYTFPGENTPLFQNIQVQNYNGIQQQAFMQRAECCAEVRLPFSIPGKEIDINGSTNWTDGNNGLDNLNSPVYITEDLIFEPGSSVDIYNMTLEFAPTANMIIKPGAKVRLITTKLTAFDCPNHMWPGVDVLGTYNQSQLNPSTTPYQGQLRMETNSTIEHARIGAEIGTTVWNSGGVIRAYHSQFLNCQNGVKWMNYAWSQNGQLVGNYAYFHKTNFIINDMLRDETITPGTMANMEGVKAIPFSICSFVNSAPFEIYPYGERGTGIRSYRASFNVLGTNSTFDGGVDETHTSFYHWDFGIQSHQGTGVYQCRNMELQDNYRGIFNSQTNFPELTYNNVTVPNDNTQLFALGSPYGFFLDRSTGYTVQENYFTSVEPYGLNVGCWVRSSGDQNNLVRRNSFENLYMGGFSQLINRHTSITGAGLQWLCNSFENGIYDLFVGADTRIKWIQGIEPDLSDPNNPLPGEPTWNKFSLLTGCIGSYFDFVIDANNSTNHVIRYMSHTTSDGIADCQSYNLQNQQLFWNVPIPLSGGFENANCPVTVQGNGHNGENPGDILAPLGLALEDYEDFQEYYDAVINQGSTQDLIALLNLAYSLESAYVRTLLMASYPLSREVLQLMLERAEYLDPWHLTEVLVANSPLDADMLAFVTSNELLTPFFMAFVNQAQGAGQALTALRTLLEIQLSQKRSAYTDLRTRASRALLFPAIPLAEDSVVVADMAAFDAMWAADQDNTARSIRAQRYFDQGLYTEALAELPNTNEGEFLVGMHELLALGAAVEGNWSELDSLQRAQLWGMWLDEGNPSRISALSILHQLGECDEMPQIEIPSQHKSAFVAASTIQSTAPEMLTASPTNATSELMVGYPTDADGVSELLLFDLEGKLVRRLPLNHNGFLSFPVGGLAVGSYLLVLLSGGINLGTARFNKVD